MTHVSSSSRRRASVEASGDEEDMMTRVFSSSRRRASVEASGDEEDIMTHVSSSSRRRASVEASGDEEDMMAHVSSSSVEASGDVEDRMIHLLFSRRSSKGATLFQLLRIIIIMWETFTTRVVSDGRVVCQEHVEQRKKEEVRRDTQVPGGGFCVYMAEAASCVEEEEALRRGLVTYNVRSCVCVVLWAPDVRALALAHFTSTSTDSVLRSAEKLLLPLIRSPPFSSPRMLYMCLGHGYNVSESLHGLRMTTCTPPRLP